MTVCKLFYQVSLLTVFFFSLQTVAIIKDPVKRECLVIVEGLKKMDELM